MKLHVICLCVVMVVFAASDVSAATGAARDVTATSATTKDQSLISKKSVYVDGATASFAVVTGHSVRRLRVKHAGTLLEPSDVHKGRSPGGYGLLWKLSVPTDQLPCFLNQELMSFEVRAYARGKLYRPVTVQAKASDTNQTSPRCSQQQAESAVEIRAGVDLMPGPCSSEDCSDAARLVGISVKGTKDVSAVSLLSINGGAVNESGFEYRGGYWIWKSGYPYGQVTGPLSLDFDITYQGSIYRISRTVNVEASY